VVPRFSQVFQDMGDRIPLMSRLLLEWGQFAHAHGLQLLAGGAALLVGLVYTLNRPQVRLALARQIQRLPQIGEVVRVYQLARFYRALGMLQQAGSPIVTALDMVVGLLPISLHPSLAAARRDIGDGNIVPAPLGGKRQEGLDDRGTRVGGRHFRAVRPLGIGGVIEFGHGGVLVWSDPNRSQPPI
jgi:general secretion pathway protein F